jgi:hypothetical protein
MTRTVESLSEFSVQAFYFPPPGLGFFGAAPGTSRKLTNGYGRY